MGISILLLGAILLELMLGFGLHLGALAMIVAHGWRAAMNNRADSGWSLARKLMIAGGVLIGLVLMEVAGVASLLLLARAS